MKSAAAECTVYGYLDSPVGQLLVAGDEDHVRLISFPSGSRAQRHLAEWRRDDAHFHEAFAQLRAYFARELTEFSFPIYFDGTEFQNAVWKALRNIPYGATTSYGALAATIGNPTASRAVGAANGSNPLPIVVPCHRVIGSNAKLTGFGGGVETKQFLLMLENPDQSQLPLFCGVKLQYPPTRSRPGGRFLETGRLRAKQTNLKTRKRHRLLNTDNF